MNTYLNEFLSGLKTQNWLTRAGQNTDGISSPFVILKTQKEDIKHHLLSDEWTNIDLDIFNEICAFADKNRAGNLINKLAEELSQTLKSLECNLRDKIAKNCLPSEVYEYSFMTIIRAYQEFVMFKKYKFKIDFNQNLLAILNQGHLPCGWVYDKSSWDKFSYSYGKLIVY